MANYGQKLQWNDEKKLALAKTVSQRLAYKKTDRAMKSKWAEVRSDLHLHSLFKDLVQFSPPNHYKDNLIE